MEYKLSKTAKVENYSKLISNCISLSEGLEDGTGIKGSLEAFALQLCDELKKEIKENPSPSSEGNRRK